MGSAAREEAGPPCLRICFCLGACLTSSSAPEARGPLGAGAGAGAGASTGPDAHSSTWTEGSSAYAGYTQLHLGKGLEVRACSHLKTRSMVLGTLGRHSIPLSYHHWLRIYIF